jgi:Fic family protein
MQTFTNLERHFALTAAPILGQLTQTEQAAGRQEAFRRQHPEAVKSLIDIARIQSVESSNAIEDVRAPRNRIKDLVEQKTTPRNRPEAEIAGYRAVLDLIHTSALAIPFRPSVVEQLHRDLYQFTANRNAGRWKKTDNRVTEERPDGIVVDRFRPVSALETSYAMDELHKRLDDALEAGTYHRLLLVGAYILDFLVIHPFGDGNGRMSRLLTLLLLYQAGYEVGRFVSLEKLIEDSKETYYEALHASTVGWHEDEHTLEPWLSYFLGILVAAYAEFEVRVGAVAGSRGAKAAAIKNFIRSRASEKVTVEEIRRAVPSASDVYIREVLRKLRDEGVLRQDGRGPNAGWRRLHTAF